MKLKINHGFARMREATIAALLGGSILLGAGAVFPNLFTIRSTEPRTPEPSIRFISKAEGIQYEHIPFIKSDDSEVFSYDLYGKTYTSKEEKLNQNSRPHGAIVLYNDKLYDLRLYNAFGKNNFFTDKYFENAKPIAKIPSYSYHDVLIEDQKIYLRFSTSMFDYTLSDRKAKLSNGLKYTITNGNNINRNTVRYLNNDFNSLISSPDFRQEINPSHGFPQTHEAKSYGNTAIFRSSFPGGSTHQNISLLILRPETSSICVCTIPLLQLVGKQTQISCAQEPEHAPGFSPRVLDKLPKAPETLEEKILAD